MSGFPGQQYTYANPDRPPDKRRKDPGEKNSFVVSEMWERHHEIVRRLALGQKNTQIAKALGISEVSVSQVKNSPIVKEKLASMVEKMDENAIDVGQRIKELAPRAIKVLESVLEDVEDTVPLSLKVKTAHDILDRAGHAAIKQVNANVMHGHFNADDLAEIKQLARDNGVIADVEYTELPE
jgi:DNA-binding CsgD family transcriptional regulator